MKPKGEQYSKVFRRAGLAWGKGDLPKAIAILQEGIALATEQGDDEVVSILQADLERYRQIAAGAAIDLSC